MNYRFQEELGKLLLRLTVGILILFHGIGKILNPAIVESIGTRLESDGWPASVAYGIYLGEVLAPLLIVFGVLARIGGVLVAINMVFAIVLSHTAQILTLSKSGGWALELQAFYLLGGIAIFLLGSGRMAVRPD
ncbi:MAG TPA: DoxX family protein [Burkholderiales bacterium]|nr:DoxX family protein [Burkholderiales bacterium]